MNHVKCKRLRISRSVTLILVLMMLCSLAACSGTGAAFSLNEKEVMLDVGGTCQLSVSAQNAGSYSIRWETSSETVATVSKDGLVTAVSGGEATISAVMSGNNVQSVCYARIVVNQPVVEKTSVPGSVNKSAPETANDYVLDTSSQGVLVDSENQSLFFNNYQGTTKVYFKASEENSSSAYWEISGTVRSLAGSRGFIGFLLKDQQGKEQLVGVYRDHIALSNVGSWDTYTELQLANNSQYVNFNQAACSFYWGETQNGGKTLHFKIVLENDVIKGYFWNDHEEFSEPALLWSIPLTNSQFGGFAAGTEYQLGLSSTNTSTYFKVSGLVVKTQQTAEAD